MAWSGRGAGVEQAWFAESLLLLGSLKLGETCVGEVMNVCLSCEVACLLPPPLSLSVSLSPSLAFSISLSISFLSLQIPSLILYCARQ